MRAAVTDPALAAILQRRRLLSEPQLAQVATWSEEDTLTEDAGTESASQQHHSMLIRPGIVQEALTAIQERPAGPAKPDDPVQCFDMATDSESEEESCASDSGLDPGHMPAQSSESTCIGDEDISSCGERPRTRLAADSLQDSTLAGEVRAAELMTGLTRAATVADLRLAVQQRISSEENVTLLTTSGGAYVPLLDDEVIGGLFDDVEDVVIQGHVFVLSGPRSGAEATRPSVVEAENAQLRAQIAMLERRLAESESTQRDQQVQEQADNSVQLVPEPIPLHTLDAAVEGPEEGEPPAIDDVEAESVPASSAAGLSEAAHCQPAPEAAAAEAAADVAPASPEPERDPSAAPGFQPGQGGMPSKCPGGASTILVSLLSMQSPDQPAMKLEMTSKSTIAELRAEVMRAFFIDERTARRLRFLRKRGTCYVSFKEAERVREKIFLHDPDIRALSGPKLRVADSVGGSPIVGQNSVGLEHNLPLGLDENIRSFILHTFARMSTEERTAWNALPKFVIWTMWFDIMSSPLFQKCLDPVFRQSVFGLDFDKKAPMHVAKDDKVLKEYAFHKKQLISVWFQDEPVRPTPDKAEVSCQQAVQSVRQEHYVLDDGGLFDFDALDEVELAGQAS
ncbi:Rrbp1 [Symbiodinium sp. CCMP2456]|nr:Rrbp1 [Symbiodinium sp. CCMP2456]